MRVCMKKIGTKTLVLALLAVVLLGGAGIYAMNGQKAADVEQTAAMAPASGDTAPEVMTFDNATLPTNPMGVRSLGDPNAPVKVEEFASLTCSHCAHFEETTFPELKKKYIDTGKVFYTFTDFPLNAPALDASMLARCLPPERYFPFIVLLFASQEEWAFAQDPRTNLRQSAKLAGLSDDKINDCLANNEIKEGIIQSMQQAQGKGIQSTPSFLINGKLVTGAIGIEAFEKEIAEAETKNSEKKGQ